VTVENDQSFFRRASHEAGYQKGLIAADISLAQKILGDILTLALLPLRLNEITGLQVLENKCSPCIFEKCRFPDA
jgi:hypothetical protein